MMQIIKVKTCQEFQIAMLTPGEVHILIQKGFPREDYVEVIMQRLPEGKSIGLDLE